MSFTATHDLTGCDVQLYGHPEAPDATFRLTDIRWFDDAPDFTVRRMDGEPLTDDDYLARDAYEDDICAAATAWLEED